MANNSFLSGNRSLRIYRLPATEILRKLKTIILLFWKIEPVVNIKMIWIRFGFNFFGNITAYHYKELLCMINVLLVKLYLFELKIECEIQAKIGSKSVKIIAKIGLKTGKFAPDKRWFWQWVELYRKLKPS